MNSDPNDPTQIIPRDTAHASPLLKLGLDDTCATESGTPHATANIIEQPGEFIGRYKLVKVLGEGGFGIVWQAVQVEPFQRDVALKVIKPGMDSREIIARFEAERQALALMDHPHIAAVLDAGTTDNGRPFFVMELVDGLPITSYCDKHRLTVKQRLQLFLPVCQAVQHAHQKAILHRDLKPSNILVTEVDGKPVPKVIDFGIAKALAGRDEISFQASLLQTRADSVIGTPQYMSPEQAGLDGLDIDTRSDIYSLGIILYELITGYTPLSVESLRNAGVHRVLQIIRDEEAKRPSSCLLPRSEKVSETSSLRQAEPHQLEESLRGDLDWITLKALDKDRARRYQTSGELAADIERHLNHEMVSACPPSTSYRLQKLIKKHKVLVVTSLTILVCLLGGLAVSTYAFFREHQALEREEKQRLLAEERQLEAQKQEKQARLEAHKAKLVSNFTLDVLRDGAIISKLHGNRVVVRTMLQNAGKRLDETLGLHPDVQLALNKAILNDYFEMGETHLARDAAARGLQLVKKVHGDQHTEYLWHSRMLGRFQAQCGDATGALITLANAEKLAIQLKDELALEYTLKEQSRALAQLKKYNEALPKYREFLEMRRQSVGLERLQLLGELREFNQILSQANLWDEINKNLAESRKIIAEAGKANILLDEKVHIEDYAARFYLKKGDVALFDHHSNLSLGMLRERNDPISLILGLLRNTEDLRTLNRKEECLLAMREALSLLNTHFSKDIHVISRVATRIGREFYSAGDNASAIALYHRAQAAFKTLGLKNRDLIQTGLFEMDAHLAAGDFQKAEKVGFDLWEVHKAGKIEGAPVDTKSYVAKLLHDTYHQWNAKEPREDRHRLSLEWANQRKLQLRPNASHTTTSWMENLEGKLWYGAKSLLESDNKSYEQELQELMSRYGNASKPYVAPGIATMIVLAEVPQKLQPRLKKLETTFGKPDPSKTAEIAHLQMLRGAIQLRLGEWQQSLETLQGINDQHCDSMLLCQILSLRSIAAVKLKLFDQAKISLKAAEQITMTDPVFADSMNHHSLTAKLFFNEATDCMTNSNADTRP